jgi:hypothetical protein
VQFIPHVTDAALLLPPKHRPGANRTFHSQQGVPQTF